MRRLAAACIAWLLCLAGPALAVDQAAEQVGSLPRGKGLPLVVKAAVGFVDLTGLDENNSVYKGTVDIRLRWEDPRLRRTPEETQQPPQTFRGAAAEAELAKNWSPPFDIVNLRGAPTATETGLRIFPDGQIELMRRVTGDFLTPQDVERFPFDLQKLQVKIAIRNYNTDAVSFAFVQDDLDFSRPAATASLDGWELKFVNLKTEEQPGWYGESHAMLVAALDVERKPGPAIAAIYIPLFASLLIPMLAIWLHKIEDGVFEIDTFELVNVIIGGLFAVIALNFTVNSSFQALAASDNSVNRLFALNYIALGTSLLINIALCRFSLVARAFGVYVQEQLFLVLLWAFPLLILTMALSFILVAVV